MVGRQMHIRPRHGLRVPRRTARTHHNSVHDEADRRHAWQETAQRSHHIAGHRPAYSPRTHGRNLQISPPHPVRISSAPSAPKAAPVYRRCRRSTRTWHALRRHCRHSRCCRLAPLALALSLRQLLPALPTVSADAVPPVVPAPAEPNSPGSVAPSGVPSPVHASQPAAAEYAPLLPDFTSWKPG